MWNISDKTYESIKEEIDSLENFDWKYYLRSYPDLLRNGIDTELKAKQHYILHGIREKRKICAESEPDSNILKQNSLDVNLFLINEINVNSLKIILNKLSNIKNIKNINVFTENNNFEKSLLENLIKKESLEIHFKKNIDIFKLKDFLFSIDLNIKIPEDLNLDELFDFLIKNEEYAAIGSSNLACYVSSLGEISDLNFLSLKNPEFVNPSFGIFNLKNIQQLHGFEENLNNWYLKFIDLSLKLRQSGFFIKFLNLSLPLKENLKITEEDRSYFLGNWSNFLNKNDRILKNKVLINLNSLEESDIVNSYYSVRNLVRRFEHSKIDLFVDSKYKFLFNKLKVSFIEKDFNFKNYDNVFNLEKINKNIPFFHFDVICGLLNCKNLNIKEEKLITQLLETEADKYPILNFKYVILNLKSTNYLNLIETIKKILKSYKIVLIGDLNLNNLELENFLEDQKKDKFIVDYRGINFKDALICFSRSKFYISNNCELDCLAQLLNKPTFIIDETGNSLFKLYRFANSHISRDKDNVEKDLLEFISSNFIEKNNESLEFLRQKQRNLFNILLKNPFFYNNIFLEKENLDKEITTIIKIKRILEEYKY